MSRRNCPSRCATQERYCTSAQQNASAHSWKLIPVNRHNRTSDCCSRATTHMHSHLDVVHVTYCKPPLDCGHGSVRALQSPRYSRYDSRMTTKAQTATQTQAKIVEQFLAEQKGFQERVRALGFA